MVEPIAKASVNWASDSLNPQDARTVLYASGGDLTRKMLAVLPLWLCRTQATSRKKIRDRIPTVPQCAFWAMDDTYIQYSKGTGSEQEARSASALACSDSGEINRCNCSVWETAN